MSSKIINRYQEIEEKALVNFEMLLNFWGIDYKQISPVEFDFLNPLRNDTNFGACRFNIEKGKGADFAGVNFTQADYSKLGAGFSKEDFMNNTKDNQSNWGFNVIGLTQRLKQLKSYKEAAEHLDKTLKELSQMKEFKGVTQEALNERLAKIKAANDRKKNMAHKIWGLCQNIEGTLGEVYLHSRCIYLDEQEPTVKFHPKVMCKEINGHLPALIMKVEVAPGSGIIALHRIYLSEDGKGKAKLDNPKMALASIKGAAVWLGTPGEELSIVEGPENAFSIRSLGFPFVACSISAPNFSNLTIPNYVKRIILLPDPDEAGKNAAEKANLAYKAQGKEVIARYPKQVPGVKKTDWNGILIQKIKSIQEASSNNVRTNGK